MRVGASARRRLPRTDDALRTVGPRMSIEVPPLDATPVDSSSPRWDQYRRGCKRALCVFVCLCVCVCVCVFASRCDVAPARKTGAQLAETVAAAKQAAATPISTLTTTSQSIPSTMLSPRSEQVHCRAVVVVVVVIIVVVR